MNVDDAQLKMLDPSQLHALSVIAEASRGEQVQIPHIIAAAAASGVNITTSDEVAHIVAVQDENVQQAHVEMAQDMEEEQPMETA